MRGIYLSLPIGRGYDPRRPLALKIDEDGQGAVIFASNRTYRRSVQ